MKTFATALALVGTCALVAIVHDPAASAHGVKAPSREAAAGRHDASPPVAVADAAARKALEAGDPYADFGEAIARQAVPR